MRDVYKQLGQLRIDTATSGSATTAGFTQLVGTKNTDDAGKGGICMVLYDAGGAGASPEGKFGLISGYVDSTGTYTFATVTDAVAAGDRIGIAGPRYPYQLVIDEINRALQTIGPFESVPDISITTAEGQTEYTLPAAVTQINKIEISTSTDTNDYQWQDIGIGWTIQRTATVMLLVFDEQPTAGQLLKIWYKGAHPAVGAYNDVITPYVHPELLVLQAASYLLNYQVSRTAAQDKAILQQFNDVKAELDRARLEHRVPSSKKTQFLKV
jgi:hypothetical protein